jgi:hypothetical protein
MFLFFLQVAEFKMKEEIVFHALDKPEALTTRA